VTLDGKQHKVDDPLAYAVYKAIAQQADPIIPKRKIGDHVKGVRGTKTIPNLIAKLPLVLRKTVKRNNRGFWTELPPLPEKNPDQDHSGT